MAVALTIQGGVNLTYLMVFLTFMNVDETVMTTPKSTIKYPNQSINL